MRLIKQRVLIGHRWAWFAIYPSRGLKCQIRVDSMRGFFEVAIGPVYLCLGPGETDC